MQPLVKRHPLSWSLTGTTPSCGTAAAGSRVTDIVHPPQDLVESRGGLRLNGEYYIKKHVSMDLTSCGAVKRPAFPCSACCPCIRSAASRGM